MILPLLLLFSSAYAEIICPTSFGRSDIPVNNKDDYYASYELNVFRDGASVVFVIGCGNGTEESGAIELAKQDAYGRLDRAFEYLQIEVTESECKQQKLHAYHSDGQDWNITGVIAICTVINYRSTAQVAAKSVEPVTTKSADNYQLKMEEYDESIKRYKEREVQLLVEISKLHHDMYDMKERNPYNASALAVSIPLIIGSGICGGIAYINKEKRDRDAEEYDTLTGIEHDWFLTEETKKQQNALLISAAMLGTTGLAVMIAGAF